MGNLAPLHLIHSEGLQERAYSLQHHQNPRLCTKCHILLVRRDFEFNFSPFVCVGSKGAVEVFKNSSQNYFVQADVTYCRYGQSVVIVVRYLIKGRETMADSAATAFPSFFCSPLALPYSCRLPLYGEHNGRPAGMAPGITSPSLRLVAVAPRNVSRVG